MDKLRPIWIPSGADRSTDAACSAAAAVSRLSRSESGAGAAHQEQWHVQGLPHRGAEVPPATTGAEDPVCVATDKTTVTGRTTKSMIFWQTGPRGHGLGLEACQGQLIVFWPWPRGSSP